MLRITAVCAVLLVALACQAFAVTATIETFDGDYVGGPIGPTLAAWNFLGYGPPANMAVETGIVSSGSASRWNIPGSIGTPPADPDGFIAIYKTGFNVDTLALAGSPIDWTKPVSMSIDVFGADYGTNTKWESKLDMQGCVASAEWGNENGLNEQWTTLTATIDPAKKSGNLILWLNFDFTGKAFPQTNAMIWDNLRIDYSTAVPEPGSIVALLTGMLGLGGMIRRKK